MRTFRFGLLAAVLLLFAGGARGQGTLYQTNLMDYFRADVPSSITLTAGRVSAWVDQSGNSNNATQSTAGNRPSYVSGPEPYVAFECNQNNFMTLAGTIASTQAYSFFFVADFVSVRGNSGNAQVYLTAQDAGTANHYVFWAQGSGFLAVDTGTGAFPGTRLLTGRHIVAVTASASATTLYIDDAIYTIAAQANKAYNNFYLGNGVNAYYSPMNLYTLAQYNATLTPTQMAGNIQYLAARYGIKMGKRRVNTVVDGDSISAAWGSSNNTGWVSQLGLPADWQTTNYGFPGLSLGAGAAATNPSANFLYAADIAPLYDSAAEYNVLIVYLGTNSMAAGGLNLDAATTTTHLQYYLTQARLTGWQKIVVVTCLPRNDLDDTRRTTFNTNVRALVAGGYCDVVSDIAGDARFAVTTAYGDPRYFYYDTVHPSTTGHGIIAAITRKAIYSVVPVSLGGYYVAPSVSVKGGF